MILRVKSKPKIQWFEQILGEIGRFGTEQVRVSASKSVMSATLFQETLRRAELGIYFNGETPS